LFCVINHHVTGQALFVGNRECYWRQCIPT